jgi:hypothetical protein
MKNKKSTGISSFLLKKVCFIHERTPTWKHKHIIKNDNFFSCLKKSVVKPIPKKGPMDQIITTQLPSLLLYFNVLDKVMSN